MSVHGRRAALDNGALEEMIRFVLDEARKLGAEQAEGQDTARNQRGDHVNYRSQLLE